MQIMVKGRSASYQVPVAVRNDSEYHFWQLAREFADHDCHASPDDGCAACAALWEIRTAGVSELQLEQLKDTPRAELIELLGSAIVDNDYGHARAILETLGREL